jgi:two-component system alkaline phosphatase synthesis response regulator PhoP
VLTVLASQLAAVHVNTALDDARYETRTANTQADAVRILAEWRPHAVILDLDLDSREVLRQVQAMASPVPVIAVTQNGDLNTKLAAFEAGIDDVLSLPFEPEELLARLTALLRRSYDEPIPFTPVIKLAGLEIDLSNKTVRIDGSELQMTTRERSLLYLLAENPGRVISRDEILATLWGDTYVANSNVVDRHVRNLRALLHDDWRRPRFIATIPRRGYMFLPQ